MPAVLEVEVERGAVLASPRTYSGILNADSPLLAVDRFTIINAEGHLIIQTTCRRGRGAARTEIESVAPGALLVRLAELAALVTRRR